MHNSSKKEFSLLGAFLMGLLWLLRTLTLRAIELLDSTLLGPAQKVIVKCVVQFFVGPLISIVDAVTGTHRRSATRPHETLTTLATFL